MSDKLLIESVSDEAYSEAKDFGYSRARRQHKTGRHYADGWLPGTDSEPELRAAFRNGVTEYRDEHDLPDED